MGMGKTERLKFFSEAVEGSEASLETGSSVLELYLLLGVCRYVIAARLRLRHSGEHDTEDGLERLKIFLTGTDELRDISGDSLPSFKALDLVLVMSRHDVVAGSGDATENSPDQMTARREADWRWIRALQVDGKSRIMAVSAVSSRMRIARQEMRCENGRTELMPMMPVEFWNSDDWRPLGACRR
jgi:hypothetical protein